MTEFSNTPEGQAFIASGDSRETSPEIMRAIASRARDYDIAVSIWDLGIGLFSPAECADFVEDVIGDTGLDPTDFVWGDAGSAWAK